MILNRDEPLENNMPLNVEYCLPNGRYSFTITHSGGDGFGDNPELTLGYFTYSNDLLLGGAVSFFSEDVFTFTLSLTGDEEDGDEFEFLSCYLKLEKSPPFTFS